MTDPVQDDKTGGPPIQLSIEQAARLFRALERAQTQLTELAKQRFSATFDADHEQLDSLLLGIGFRIVRLGGGFNGELVKMLYHDRKTETVDASQATCPVCGCLRIGLPLACPEHSSVPTLTISSQPMPSDPGSRTVMLPTDLTVSGKVEK